MSVRPRNNQGNWLATLSVGGLLTVYVSIIAYTTMDGIAHQEDSPLGREKTRRYCCRLALAIVYCIAASTLLVSATARRRIDAIMERHVRRGLGASLLNAAIVLYNCVQVLLCLVSAQQCLLAYWKYHSPGYWLGFEMTNWSWALPFLSLYSDLKALDLMDTLWIASRGSWNHLSLLHVMHHTTMILPYEVWRAFYDTSEPIVYTLIPLMNSIVHALLYTYYTIVLGRKSTNRSFRALAQIFYEHRGILTCIQYVQFPTAVAVAGLAAFHPDGHLPPSLCYGLIGALNAVLFAPLLPFFKKKKDNMPFFKKKKDNSLQKQKQKPITNDSDDAKNDNKTNKGVSSRSSKDNQLWFVVEGRAVDVTEFSKVHPGGAKILEKVVGRDVTHHFRAFHPRQELVWKRLASLPSYNNPKETSKGKGHDFKASNALEKLEAQMRQKGFFGPPNATEAWTRIVEVLLLFLAAAHLCCRWRTDHVAPGTWVDTMCVILAGALWGFASGRCGWIQHDAGHKALFASQKANRIAQALALTVGMSGASFEWNRRHNDHHAVTNEHHSDPDINTTPLLMFYDDAKAYRPPSRQMNVPKWVLQYQAELFTPVLCPAVALGWALYSHPRACLVRGDYLTLVALGASHVLRALVALHVTSNFAQACLFIGCIWTVGPAYLFTLFAMSHTTMPVHDDGELHWARSIFRTTVDASPYSAWASWWTGNLNCQVAHHLWPRMPTYRLSMLTDDIAQLAKDLDEPYHSTTVAQALIDMYANLRSVGIRALGHKGEKSL